MDEGVVEGGINVGNAKYQLSLCDLGTERNGGFLCDPLDFWWLQKILLARVAIDRQNPYHFLVWWLGNFGLFVWSTLIVTRSQIW